MNSFFKANSRLTIQEIFSVVDIDGTCRLHPEPTSDDAVTHPTSIEGAHENAVIFFDSEKKFLHHIPTISACLIVIRGEWLDLQHPSIKARLNKGENKKIFFLTCDNPAFYFAKIMQLFYPMPQYAGKKRQKDNISSRAIIAKTAILEQDVTIADNAIIGENVRIKKGAYIGENSVIGDDSFIGENTYIANSCSVHYSIIGDNSVIHPGAVLGCRGFGMAHHKGDFIDIPHIGHVEIGDNVEIGANVCIDRGMFDATYIGDNVRIDNLVQIGHNCHIENNVVLAGQAGVAGSVKIGAYSMVGGATSIADHVSIGKFAKIGGKSGVISEVKDKETVFGIPAMPIKEYFRAIAALKKLGKK